MRRIFNWSLVFAVSIIMVAVGLLSGCGGGGGSAPVAVNQSTGQGKIAAQVVLTGRVAGRAVAQSSSEIVTVTITITGDYSEDGEPFDPITTTVEISLADGYAQVSVVDVPIGYNHLLVAEAQWSSGTETVMAIIPEVIGGSSSSVVANQESTAVAAAAIYYADQNGISLSGVSDETIYQIHEAVEQLAASGVSYYDMSPEDIAVYIEASGVAAGIEIFPATATVVIGTPVQFFVDVVDSNGYPMSGATPTVTFSDSTVGSIDDTGLFTPAGVGNGTITATYDTFTGTAEVTVIASCSTNADCDDVDPYTFDECLASGSSTTCTHTPVECTEDIDCDDANPLSIETCMDAGTAIATCYFDVVVCNSDADCAIDYPICFDPGLVTSACVECDVDADCDDLSTLTLDKCDLPGTSSALCSYTTVACSTDADCVAGTCIDAGLSTAYCSMCSIDTDCDDGDPSTIDTCYNAGTASAVCGGSTIVPSAYISTSTTWDITGSPYIMVGQIAILPGVTLAIDPGVEIYFQAVATSTQMDFFGNSNPSLGGIMVYGDLSAIGTSAEPITFTLDPTGSIGPGKWGGIYFASQGSGDLQYVNMDYPSYAIHAIDYNGVMVPPTISNVAITNAGGPDPTYMASYHIMANTQFGWTPQEILHYNMGFAYQSAEMTGVLPDINGNYAVRIKQVGMKAAQIDSVELIVNGQAYPMSYAREIGSGADAYAKMIARDNDVIDAWSKTFEIGFDVPAGITAQSVKLNLVAREENENSLNGAIPFYYPDNKSRPSAHEGRYYSYTIGSNYSSITVDGQLNARDMLGQPMFKEFTRPQSGHPDSFTYGYMMNDDSYLYAAIDFTSDNTYDGDADYSAIIVKVDGQPKRFEASVPDQRYGVPGYTYTDKVSWQHKVYEFKIPLSEIGSPAAGETIEVIFESYGTASTFQHVVMLYTYSPTTNPVWTIDNLSIDFDSTNTVGTLNGFYLSYATSSTLTNISVNNIPGVSFETYDVNGSTFDNISSVADSSGASINMSLNGSGISLSNCVVSDATSLANLQLSGNYIDVSNCQIYNSSGYGLRLSYASNVTIDSIDVSGNMGGIYLISSDLTLTNSTISENCGYGIGGDSAYPSTMNISNCSFENNVNLAVYGYSTYGWTSNMDSSYLAGNYGQSAGTVELETTNASATQFMDMSSVSNPLSSLPAGVPTPISTTTACGY